MIDLPAAATTATTTITVTKVAADVRWPDSRRSSAPDTIRWKEGKERGRVGAGSWLGWMAGHVGRYMSKIEESEEEEGEGGVKDHAIT
jgi:hypothetical protein